MDNKEKYLQFPLFLLRELFIDKEKIINEIICYGIYRFSKRIKNELIDIAKQSMYGYYRGDLTKDLHNFIQYYIESGLIELDEDYNGFSGSEFTPELDQILDLFEKDNSFKEKAIEFLQIKKAYDILGIEGDIDNCLWVGKRVEKTIPKKEPFPMVSKSLLFKFRDNEKNEFDLIQLAVYISIRSILGRKSYCRTNKAMIICRAFGYASKKHLPKNLKPVLKDLFAKYSKRYHIDKVITFLELNWNVITYSNNIRGMYIGLENKITIDNLILLAETKKLKNQKETLKKKKNEAKEKALRQLNQ